MKTKNLVIDAYTLPHFAIGMSAALMGLDVKKTLVFFIGFESLENILKDEFKTIFPETTHDSFSHQIVDVVVNMLGYAFGKYQMTQKSAIPVIPIILGAASYSWGNSLLKREIVSKIKQ